MDYVSHFRREVLAFEAAGRRAADGDGAPVVPSCPSWSVSDLILHLGGVHRYVAHVLANRLPEPPDTMDSAIFKLPADREGWPAPENPPHLGPVPRGLVDWFAQGAAELGSLFASSDPDERVWTWSDEQSVGFWLRMQSIEAAVHRWDAENATGTPEPVETELAADAVLQVFEVMAPSRRARMQAPPGTGERYRFRRTDGPGEWAVYFEGDDVRLVEASGACDVELAGAASDLMLFLWQRIPADRLEVKGDQGVLDRFFTLVPPV